MIGVVFDGGGVKGSYQIGAYLALKKCGIKPNIITGTSIGAFNGALCASHMENEAKKLWESVNFADIFGIKESEYNSVLSETFKSRLKGEINVIKSVIKNGGIDTLGLKKFIDEYIDEDKLRKSNIDFGLATLNFSKLKPTDIYLEQIPKGKLGEYILASAYLPGLKREKIIDNNNYFDGGFYNTCPVNMCIDAGCKTIYVVRVKGIGYTQKIKANNSKIIFIETKNNLGSIIFTNQDKTRYNINRGYYDTLKVIKKLDGVNYYFYNRHFRTYDLLIRNVDKKTLKAVQKKFGVVSNKKLIINCLEYVMNNEGYPIFDIYGPILIIHELKKILDSDDVCYQFIKELSVI